MKITIPESLKDIKLFQYQEYSKNPERAFEIFTGLEADQVEKLQYDSIMAVIEFALNEPAEFSPTFKIGDLEFGFIPNFDKITILEYRDLSLYGTGVDDLHKLMAVLFRPIKSKDGFSYKIVKHTGVDKYSEIMKHAPMNVVNGALVFFLNLATELLNYTQRFTKEEQQREKPRLISLKNGGGMRQFWKCVKAKFGNWIRY